jgi:transposase-like protein
MVARCPHCRSTHVTLALEIPSKKFFICQACAHRWAESKAAAPGTAPPAGKHGDSVR